MAKIRQLCITELSVLNNKTVSSLKKVGGCLYSSYLAPLNTETFAQEI